MSSDKIANILEANGWTRAIAGESDFSAAVSTVAQMIESGKGLIVSGEYGVGKTALTEIVARGFGADLFKVRLALNSDLEKLLPDWQELFAQRPYEKNVFLDDLGVESPLNDFGVRLERVGDFIVTYHELRQPFSRLFITTNLTTTEIDARYGGRVLSRLKDLCVPLRLTGKDKREWTLPKGGAR